MKDPTSEFESLKLRFPEDYRKRPGIEVVDHRGDDGYRVTAIRRPGQEPVIYEIASKADSLDWGYLLGVNWDVMELLNDGWKRYQSIVKAMFVGGPFNEERTFKDLTKAKRDEISAEIEEIITGLTAAKEKIEALHDEKPIQLGEKTITGKYSTYVRLMSKLKGSSKKRKGPDNTQSTLMVRLRPSSTPKQIVKEFYPSATGDSRLDLTKKVSTAKSQLRKRTSKTSVK